MGVAPAGNDVALGIDDQRLGRSGADINADKIFCHERNASDK
jgi:hypothetical protein